MIHATMKKTIKDIALDYVHAFSNKDLDAINELFENDIELRDWEQFVSGKHKVLAVNKRLFESIEDLNISVLNLFQIDMIVVCELEVSINAEKLLVVDVIEFSRDKKIRNIRAYKG